MGWSCRAALAATASPTPTPNCSCGSSPPFRPKARGIKPPCCSCSPAPHRRFGVQHATNGVLVTSFHHAAHPVQPLICGLIDAFMLIKAISNGAGVLPRASLSAPPGAPHPTQPRANRCPMQAAWMSSGLGAEPAAIGEALAVLLDERRPPVGVNGLEAPPVPQIRPDHLPLKARSCELLDRRGRSTGLRPADTVAAPPQPCSSGWPCLLWSTMPSASAAGSCLPSALTSVRLRKACGI